MQSPLAGGCLCGKVRFETNAEPLFSFQCYCRDCQHVSGGGHLPQFAVKRDALAISGPVKAFRLKSDSGNEVENGFCSECGSPIYKTTTRAADLIFLVPGSLDDPARYEPGRNVFEDRRLPWDKG